MQFNGQRKLMKLSRFPLLWSIAMLAVGISTGTGQTNVPVPQNALRAVPGNAVRGSNVRPNNSNPQHGRRGPANVSQRPLNPVATQMQSQPPTNFRPNYQRYTRQLNHRPAATATRQDLAAVPPTQPGSDVLAKNDVAENQLPLANAPPNAKIEVQRDPRPQEGAPDTLTAREARKTGDRAQHHKGNGSNHRNYFDALRTHRHEWHDRDWWKRNCNTIVFVTGGYYFLDASYWYPAWGYDPANSYYDYDGPIYTYGNLLPDQVIANVQGALQDAGYYFGAVTGSLSVETRTALVNFQRDQGLIVTGAIDEPTVQALGLY
jgi:putative peptidoglycan binding protein